MWVVIFADVRELSSAPRGAAGGKKFLGHFFLVRSAAARKNFVFPCCRAVAL